MTYFRLNKVFFETKKRFIGNFLLLFILLTSIAFSIWILIHADRAMRRDLIQKTEIAAQAVRIDLFKKLSGTEADIETPAYLDLKEKLAALVRLNPHYRFAYLMGMH